MGVLFLQKQVLQCLRPLQVQRLLQDWLHLAYEGEHSGQQLLQQQPLAPCVLPPELHFWLPGLLLEQAPEPTTHVHMNLVPEHTI
jgi:hypothetical protein